MPYKTFSFLVLLLGIQAISVLSARGEEFGNALESPEAPWLKSENHDEGESEAEHLETDRDSFTPATTTVGNGRVIFESAYSFIQNRTAADEHSYPEIITRVGLTKRLELRLGWNYESGGGGSVSGGDAGGELEEAGSRTESQTLYGFKYSLTKQQTWIPQSAVIVQATTPTSGPNTFNDTQVGYVFGWKFLHDWQLDSSVRYVSTKEEGDHFNEWAPSVVLKVPVTDRWNAHAEYFGIITDGKVQARNHQYFSPGIHYLFSPNCEVGVRVGWGMTEDAANFFTNVGFGLRL